MTGGSASTDVNLRRERISRGWSQRKAAEKIGVSATSVRRAEDGDSVELAVAHKIATAYGLDLFAAFPAFNDEAEGRAA